MLGQILGDRYQLQALLGRGGMATVWRAVDLRLDRQVAVKILGSAGRADPVALERLHREARTVARLAHPNIVAVHDFSAGNDTAYLVMELVEGGSLADLLAQGPLTVGQAVTIAGQTCDALAAAHAAGIVHRDIKPANLLLTADGGLKVCDFGIARLAYASTGATLTQAGTVVGTSDYMAPEQATGDATGPRTDLYAMGCVLYTMLTGAPPFVAETPIAVLQQHLNQPPRPLRTHRGDIPPELDRLVGELLAKNPADRPADAAIVRARLEQLPRALPARDVGAPAFAAGIASPATTAMPAMQAPAGRPSPTQYLPAEAHAWHTAASPSWLRRVGPRRAAAALIAVALATILWLALKKPDTSGNATGAIPSGDGTSASPQASSSPTAPTTHTQPNLPETPAGQIVAIDAMLSQLVATGQLDADAAKDLRKGLDEVARQLDGNRTNRTAEKVADLQKKVSELSGDGELADSGSGMLTASLDQLAASLPQADPKKNN
jgi:serine/threonine-protein kinase